MHDGRFSTLEEVVQFYSSGVQDTPFLDPRLRDPVQLNLTQEQIGDIVAFLNTLTDDSFLANPIFSDPFVTLPGDYNGDGVVNTADYVVWRKTVGDTTSLVADGNNDHLVDSDDHTVWRQNLGKTWQDLAYGSRTANSPVPEPSAAALVAIASFYALTRRRRAQRAA